MDKANLLVSSTLKPLTNAHTVRGRPTLKDVERFRNGSNLLRGREHFIVKLIVNQSKLISNKLLSIYNSETTTPESYVDYGSTKDHIVECQHSFSEEQRRFTSEGTIRTTPYKPCDSESKVTFPMNISMVNIILLLVFCLLINMNGYFTTGLMMITILLLISYILIVHYFVPSFDVYCETIVNSSLSDCNVLDKANDLTVHAYNDIIVTINITKNTRSRYSKYVYYNYRHVKLSTHGSVFKRDREPSRIPVRTLRQLNNKSRKLRQFVYRRIRSNVPKSSKIHSYITHSKGKKYGQCYAKFKRKITKGRFVSRGLSFGCRTSKYLSLFSCNKLMSLYKSQSHAISHCQSKLYTDIEKNPGPNIVPSKTITAPYNQGNVAIFGQNAGQQCVAMSLCSLIYNTNHGINSSNDLVNIMNIGNQLYSRLSQSARQAFLLQTELPTMLNVFDTDYELQYSESFTGTLHQQTTIEGYNYCTSLEIALQSLMSDNYTSFMLTIGSTAVAIYRHGNMGFKVFDSHARDSYGRSNINGTCVLLELPSLNSLIYYFQSIHNNVIFEIKGAKIQNVQGASIQTANYLIRECTNFNLSCTVAIYSICYSIMKSCGYWNSNTLSNIVDGGKQLCKNLSLNSFITPGDLPKTIHVCGVEVSLSCSNTTNGELSDSAESKSILKDIIINNYGKSTGFLMWFSSYCISCIFKPTTRSNYIYSFSVYDESKTPPLQYIKSINGTCALVDTIFNDILKRHQYVEQQYTIQSLLCACNEMNKNERKRLMNNQRYKQNYEAMEPRKKKILLEKKQAIYNVNKQDAAKKYKTMDKYKKAEKYRTMDSDKKQELLDNQTEKYRTMDSDKKQKLLDNQTEKYRTMGIDKKQELLDKKVEKYRTMDKVEKQELLDKKAEKYRTMDNVEKQELLHKRKQNYSRHKNKDIHSCIEQFKNKIREGPYYICCVCNRSLYKKSIMKVNTNKYPSEQVFTIKSSFDGKTYICKTCHSKCVQGKTPCQAIVNNLFVDDVPYDLECLRKLEQILIAQRIVFEKIVIMPKGQQRKIKGAICNVPVHCDQTCNILPRPPERSGIIMLKLKRKLQFRGHVYFEAVRPDFVQAALTWLKGNNALYKDVIINCTNISNEHTVIHDENSSSLPDNNTDEESTTNSTFEELPATADSNIDQVDGSNSNTDNETTLDEEQDDPLNEHRSPTNETCLQAIFPDYPVIIEENSSNVSTGREIYNVAPGENKHPVSLMTDELCEELAFPVLFPKGRFGYKAERNIKLSPVKYFNARLLHYSGRFATNPEYLFFAQFIIEQKKVSDSINIALKKVHGHALTASQVKSNTEILQNFISQDQAYLFLRQIPGSPPYWQKFMYEVVAMVKQLGIPTWFMTLSCADLRWPELFQIISRANGRNMSDEEVDALSYDEKCRLINLNPVITAKHFQYRVETFFTEILLTDVNPIGKIVYYALRIEFQMRGSPHLHALIWTSDCPKLTHDTKEDYIEYVDQHVQAYLPDKDTNPELFELVKKYQTHSHSKTCRKYKNIACRFNFGQFFTDRTIVSEPLPVDMDEEIKSSTLDRCKEILSLVKQKIDEVLNPSKPDYNPCLTQEDILGDVGITKQDYEAVLSISPDSDYGLHLKRPLDSCFTNNYFIAGIKGFAANVDLQPIFNHYKCITYVCSYFTKDETECSQAIVNAAREAKESNLNVKDGLKKIGAAFLSSREVSSQESVYRCMPELWLRKIFPKTVFVSTDMPDKRLRVAKNQQELDELDDDSTDIYKSNIIERYSLRPNNILSVNNMCLAEFASYYYKDYKHDASETADAQPEVLNDNIIEQAHAEKNDTSSLPSRIRLMNGTEVMKCRKVKAVIRYHTPNKTKEPEKYFHHLLMLYYPWREETELIGNQQSYMSKFCETNVQALVEQNKNMFEPDSDAVMEALEILRNNDITLQSYDSFNDQENEDIQSELRDHSNNDESFNNLPPEHLGNNGQTSSDQCTSGAIATYIQPSDISDDDLRQSVRSLNKEQRKAYDIVLTWCRTKVKNMNCIKPEKVDPIYLFITGGAGAGKSHLIKTIYHTSTKTFRQGPTNPEKPTVLLMAPTGVAAININGTTIHTALAIPKESGENVPPMSDQKRTQIRISLSELKLIIIDEISMVSNSTLLHIHQRLKDIFGTSSDQLCAGLSIIVVGDLYQLPPIRRKPVFEEYKNNVLNLCHPWSVFEMIELTEIMRQKDDKPFTELLNRFRTATHTEDDLKIIQSRSLGNSINNTNYPTQALHIFAENAPVDQHNNEHLEKLRTPLYRLKAIDQYPQNVSKQDIDRVLTRGRSETGGLDSEILIKVNARVMLTTNIDISDRLINGQMGTVTKIAILNHNTSRPSIIYIKFDDPQAGTNAIQKHADQYTRENNSVPIQPVLARIKVRPGKPSSPELQRLQFPITLAWACTVHKVQGLTLNEIVVSFDLNRQKHFNYGQIYVALSRATSLEGLHVIGQIENRHVRANPKVHSEYDRLRQQNTYKDPSTVIHPYTVTVTLLNIRSLSKHSIDIKHDARLTKSDILALTETQLLPHHSDNTIRDTLHPYELHRQDHPNDKYLSLALCTKRNINILNKQYFENINGLMFEILQTSINKTMKFLLIYRKNNVNTQQYFQNLGTIIEQNMIDIILGDFNINYFIDTSLNNLMTSFGYVQIVDKPTFVSSGSLLDQIFVKQCISDKIINEVITVYYSDHESVQALIKI